MSRKNKSDGLEFLMINHDTEMTKTKLFVIKSIDYYYFQKTNSTKLVIHCCCGYFCVEQNRLFDKLFVFSESCQMM